MVGALGAALLAGTGLAWASAAVATTLAALGTIAGLALVLVIVGRDRSIASIARPAAVVAVVAIGAEVGLSMGANGVAPALAWAATGATALVLGLVAGLLVDPEGEGFGSDARLSVVIEVTGWSMHAAAMWAVLTIGEPRVALSAALGAGALGGALQAARRGRRPFAWVAVGHALILIWLRLGEAGVRAPEPYVRRAFDDEGNPTFAIELGERLTPPLRADLLLSCLWDE